jgi:alkylation response protein AidB-like acyl-CoA dehydrogenase
VRKHRGITYLVVDMRSAGIDVRPLRQATGGAEFNEVFFDEVRVPVANVVGAVDDGWRVAMTTLTSERADMGSSKMVTFEEVLTLARERGATGDPLVRQGLAHLHTGYEINRFLGYRARTALSRGQAPGPEVSIAKLAGGLRLAEQADLALAIQGASGMLAGGDAIAHGFFQATVFMGQWMARIGGGTEQVQRTILADRMLGMPSEPRADRELPFRDVPH